MTSQDPPESESTPALVGVYGQLEGSPPEARAGIVLVLIQEHPEGRLVLPGRDGLRAMLDGLALARAAPGGEPEERPALSSRQGDRRSRPRLRRADLRGASLRSANLRGVDLEEADLRGADLDGADLRGATLRHANLGGARLVRANLEGANLAGSDLRGATLEGANAGGADLANALLEGANLGEADLRGAMLEEACLDGASVRFARLRGAVLEGASLRRADLRGADLGEADLRRADLAEAELEEARLPGATLAATSLRSCILREANLTSADLTGADLRGAVLNGADLREAILRDARLQEVDLSRSEIARISLGGAKLDDTQFQLTQLGGAIGEELAGDFERAAQGYLALERNFEGLGDRDAASWAYRRRRRMQKCESLALAREARSGRLWVRALRRYAQFATDQLAEWICDYGESVPRVLGSLIAVYACFALLYILAGSVVREDAGPEGTIRVLTRHPADVAVFSLLVMTMGLPGSHLLPRDELALMLTGVHAFLGITLTGLLGFVLGNRIRR